MARSRIQEFLIPPAPAPKVDPVGDVQAILHRWRKVFRMTASCGYTFVTHWNDTEVTWGVSLHNKFVGRILCAQRSDLNVFGDPLFRYERAVRSIEKTVDITRDPAPAARSRIEGRGHRAGNRMISFKFVSASGLCVSDADSRREPVRVLAGDGDNKTQHRKVPSYPGTSVILSPRPN